MLTAVALVWTRAYGLACAVGGVCVVVWGAPAAARYFERDQRIAAMNAVRPLMIGLARVGLRLVGLATVFGGVLIAVFPDQF